MPNELVTQTQYIIVNRSRKNKRYLRYDFVGHADKYTTDIFSCRFMNTHALAQRTADDANKMMNTDVNVVKEVYVTIKEI